jgi:hypothetical protein
MRRGREEGDIHIAPWKIEDQPNVRVILQGSISGKGARKS